MVSMADILNCDLMTTGGSLDVSFKKVVNTKQYETETVEVSYRVDLDGTENGRALALKQAIAEAKVEYTCMVNLLVKGYIKQDEFAKRVAQLEQNVDLVVNKMASIASSGDCFVSADGRIESGSVQKKDALEGARKVLEAFQKITDDMRRSAMGVESGAVNNEDAGVAKEQVNISMLLQSGAGNASPVANPNTNGAVNPVTNNAAVNRVAEPDLVPNTDNVAAEKRKENNILIQMAGQASKAAVPNAANAMEAVKNVSTEQFTSKPANSLGIVVSQPISAEEYYKNTNKAATADAMEGMGAPMQLDLSGYPGAEDVQVENVGDAYSLAKKLGAKIGGKHT